MPNAQADKFVMTLEPSRHRGAPRDGEQVGEQSGPESKLAAKLVLLLRNACCSSQ